MTNYLSATLQHLVEGYIFATASFTDTFWSTFFFYIRYRNQSILQNGNSHYGYVLVRSGDPGLEPLTTSAVIQSPSLFLRKLETIGFSGGGSEKHCLVAEGLGRALKVFDDIASKRDQRYAFWCTCTWLVYGILISAFFYLEILQKSVF